MTRKQKRPPWLRQSTSGKYYFDHGPDSLGHRQWQPLSFDRNTAMLMFQQITAEKLADKLGFTSNTRGRAKTVKELFDGFFSVRLAELAPETRRYYQTRSKNIIGVFGQCAVESLSVYDIQQYIDAHPHKTSCRGEIKVFNMVLAFGQRRGWVKVNPCLGVQKPREQVRKRRVTVAEFYAVRSLADPPLAAIMDLAALTAMRQRDIVLLQRQHLTEHGIAYRSSKTHRAMLIRWTPELRRAVEQLLSLQGEVSSMFVVSDERGRAYSSNQLSKQFSRLMDDAMARGVLTDRFVFHDLKAFAVTEAKAQGLDAQALAGHSDARTTKRYLRDRDIVITDPVRLDKTPNGG